MIAGLIKAYLEKAEVLDKVTEMSRLTVTRKGFAEPEIVALAAVAQNLNHGDDHAAMGQIHRDMEASGFTRVAATFAVKTLINKGLLSTDIYQDFEGERYHGYSFTEKGWNWVLANQDRFSLKARSARKGRTVEKPSASFDDLDSEMPF